MKKRYPDKFTNLFPYLLLALAGILTYVLYLFTPGIFRDDWVLYASKATGINFFNLFLSDRPGVGIYLDYLVKLLGYNPIIWKAYFIILHILASSMFYALLNKIFHSKVINLLAALLLLIYPGFLQTGESFTYQTHFLALVLGLISIFTTLKSIESKNNVAKIGFISISIITESLYLLLVEYFIGIEVLRILFVFLFIHKEHNLNRELKIAARSFLLTIPNIASALLFIFWRFWIFSSSRLDTSPIQIFSDFRTNPLHYLIERLVSFGSSFFDALLTSWILPFSKAFTSVRLKELLLAFFYALFIAMLGVLLFKFFIKLNHEKLSEEDYQLNKYLPLGVISTVFLLIPIILSSRFIEINTHYDRYTIPPVLGIVLIIAGLFVYFFKQRKLFFLLISFIVFIGCSSQIVSYLKFSDSWESKKEFWWQLYWRAPSLKSDTVLIPSIEYEFNNVWEIITPANLIWQQNSGDFTINGARLTDPTVIETLVSQSKSERSLRGIILTSDMAHALLISMPAGNGCIHVLDKKQLEYPLNLNPLLYEVGNRSNINQIDLVNNENILSPEYIFGKEPEHDWCYFYQKASLERQFGNWNEVARLGDEAFSKDLRPTDGIELMPFLEAYIYLGREEDVKDMLSIIKSNNLQKNQMCFVLDSETSGAYLKGTNFLALEESICGSND